MNKVYKITILLFFTANFNVFADSVGVNESGFSTDIAEKGLINIIDDINSLDIDTALNKSKELVKKHPKFRLAKLIYADLLNSRTGLINIDKANYDPFYQEVKARVSGKKSALEKAELLPHSLISIASEIPYILQFDLSESRLFLIENKNNQLRVIDDHYISIGKSGFGKQQEGDLKTPIGVYKVTSFLDDEQLPELYGWGAFPINYPNTLDKKENRTGHGIWLHGIPRKTYSRPPKDSEGCMVLNNNSLKRLTRYITYQQTPVILSKNIKWVSKTESSDNKIKFDQLINDWRIAWENKNPTKYLAYYSKEFNGKKRNYQEWISKKKAIIDKAKSIKIKISDLSIFKYPEREGLVYSNFYQKFESDTFTGYIWKEQYWQYEKDGKWRIIYEG